MSPQLRHWIEKTQVQLAAAAALGVAWFGLWPLVRPWDPSGPLTFLPLGDYRALILFAALTWVLAAGCAVVTISARPEGALLAAMVGVLGLALRGGPMSALLWWSADFHATFKALAAELMMMTVVVVGAAAMIWAVRAVFKRIAPAWVWQDLTPAESAALPKQRVADAQLQHMVSARIPFLGIFLAFLEQLRARRRLGGKLSPVDLVGCLAVEWAVAVVLLVVTFRSTDKGQIAFALAASFFLGGFAADAAFPVRTAVPYWLAPLVMGAIVLAMGGTVVPGQGPDWQQALVVALGRPLRAALPVYWLGAGCGGALAGLWLSRRIRDAHLHEQQTG